MAVETVFVKTAEGYHTNVFMVTNEKKFVLAQDTKKTHLVTDTEAEALVKAVTSFEVAKIVEKMRLGMIPKSQEYAQSVLMNTGEFNADPVKYTIFRFMPDTTPVANWHLDVITQDVVMNLPNGTLDDVVNYLISKKCAVANTYGKYDKIHFVDKLPAKEEVLSKKDVYVLLKQDAEKAPNTNWKLGMEDFEEFQDA